MKIALRFKLSRATFPRLERCRRIFRSASRGCIYSFVIGMYGITCAHAIVSDRHLQGVSALECDLESSPSEFRLLVNAKKHTLQLEEQAEEISYEEVSDSTLRFRLQLPDSPGRTCEIQFPAGALVCTGGDGKTDFGFCLPIQ